jgi:exosortase
MKPTDTAPSVPSARAQPPAGVLAVIMMLSGLVVGFCVQLWPEWRHNPDLSHGLFAPVVFLLLLWESRRHGPQCWLPAGRLTGLALAAALTAGLVLFAMAGLLAASITWTHALVSFVLAASLCCYLLGGLLILADERVRVLPCNWISLTAIFLWLLVTPLPNGTYTRLTLGLQGGVTGAVLHTLQLLGIPAMRHGNMIELATTTVGVEEACSGIRSLLSCVYAGFFFAAWQLRRPGGRLLLIIIAPLLALVMNFLRSLILTLLANAGRDIGGFWHDFTGYAILAITALLLAALAIQLESGREPAATVTPPVKTGNPRGALWSFWAAVTVTLALGGFYFASSRPAANAGKPAPDLAALLPPNPPGWEVITPKDLYQFAGVLQTTQLMQRTYVRPAGNGQFTQLTVYVAYWPAGQTTVSRVASHTPDACWPGAGWAARPVSDPQQIPRLAGLQLAPAEHRLFQNSTDFIQNVWFWHIYDGHAINYRDPYSVPALLHLALQYGFRRQGDQFFIRVSSNKPWPDLATEPLVREIFTNLAGIGL